MKQRAFATWKIILLIFVILAVLFGAYLGLAWILRRADNGSQISVPTPTKSSQVTSKQKTGSFDKNLVGTWISDCLVPDANSPWSEKHQFVINTDKTATHTRWSGDDHSCTTSMTLTDNYKLNFPGNNQIDFISTEGKGTIYDIYQISGNTLEFGHGFRGDNLAYDGKTGSSEDDRFVTLNSFIIYKKK